MSELARVLVADPPWEFNDKLPGKGRGAAKHYSTLSLIDIHEFVRPIDLNRHGKLAIAGAPGQHEVDLNAYLFLWRVSSQVREAYEVIAEWGFEPKTELVWIKKTVNGNRHFGMGHHLRAEHETCIVATRGRVKPKVKNIRSTFEAPVGRHSEKPEAFYEIVEEMCEGPYVELFARKYRIGWTCLGNEVE